MVNKIKYDLNRPWLTLDPWQKEYISELGPCFLLTGRQVGKSTAMSIKAVELCVKHYKKGEIVLINSITEKQAYIVMAKAQAYARTKYPKKTILKGPDKPTKHKQMFINGTGIFCHAAGDTGEGLRGFTIKKHMVDEGSRMSEEFFIATRPMLSVIGGTMDISSTPFGRLHKDGSEKFFYKCSKNEKFRKFYISGEDCPRHSKDFLEQEKKEMSKLEYAQEYLAKFTDDLTTFFDEELIKRCCILKKPEHIQKERRYFMGCDVAGKGKDDTTIEILKELQDDKLHQVANIILKQKFTTQISKKIINLNSLYDFNSIGVDDGGIGFGVFSELLDEDSTKRKVKALNNASRDVDSKGEKSKKLLKEEMYINLLTMMENNKIQFLDDDEVIASLKSIQYEYVISEGHDTQIRIFGSYSHITEGLIRAAWCAKGKGLKIYVF